MSVSSIKLSVACLLLLGVALIFVSEGAEAIDPEWSYETGGDVMSVAISADGEYIVASSYDYKLYLFGKDSSTPLWSYSEGNGMDSVAISADGEYIAVGSRNDKVHLFDKDSSTPLWSYAADGSIVTVAISADGEYIAAGSEDNKVYLFDKDSGNPLLSYSTGGEVRTVSISADGEYIAAGSDDYKVYLFDKNGNTLLWSYTTEGAVRSVAISPDGEYIAVGSGDKKIYLFDKDSSTPLWSYTTGGSVYSVTISEDGEYIAAGNSYYDSGTHGKLYLFGKDGSTPLWSYTTEHDVRSVDISANGKYIAVGSLDDKVYLFDKDSSTPLWSYTTGNYVLSVSISADGKYIAAGSEDDNVYAFYNKIEEEIELPEQGFTLELAAEYDTDGGARDVVVLGDLAYIADYDEGFLILDISNISDINELDRYKQSGFIYSSNIQIVGNYAFVAEGSEVNVYDISNPYEIIQAGNYDVDGALQSDIVVRGDYAFIAAGTEKGVVALDISDVSDITLLDYYNTNGNAYGLQIVGDLVYVADVDGIVILNVSNPSSIEFVGDYDTDGDAFNLAIDGNLAYVAVDGEGLVILDVSNPEDIVSVGLYEASRSADVRVVGKYALFGMRENGVIALDITDPSNPEFVTSYDTNGDVYDLIVTNDYVFVADYDNGLVVLEIVPNEIDGFSLTLEGPSDESLIYSPVNLSWSVNSNSDEQFTYDLYFSAYEQTIDSTTFLSTMPNASPKTNDISDIHYFNGSIWFSEYYSKSIKKLDLDSNNISYFIQESDYLEFVVDITVDELSGKLYTVSRPNGIYSSVTWICEWTADAQLSACNKIDVKYGLSVEYYSGSVFVLQAHSSNSYQKVVELIFNSNEVDIDSKLLLNESYSYSDLPGYSLDFDINPDNGDIWITNHNAVGAVIMLNSSNNYEWPHLIFDTGVHYSQSIQINNGFVYISSYSSWMHSFGGIKRINLSDNFSIEDYKLIFKDSFYSGQMTFDQVGNMYISTDYRSYSISRNLQNQILKFGRTSNGIINLDSLAFEFDYPIFENITVDELNITSIIRPGNTYYWQIIAKGNEGTIYKSKISSFHFYASINPLTYIEGPAEDTALTRAEFLLGSDSDGIAFTCKLDNGDWFECGFWENSLGYTYSTYFASFGSFSSIGGCTSNTWCSNDFTDLSLGSHSFVAFATDQYGNDGPKTYWNWTISGSWSHNFTWKEMGNLPEMINDYTTNEDYSLLFYYDSSIESHIINVIGSNSTDAEGNEISMPLYYFDHSGDSWHQLTGRPDITDSNPENLAYYFDVDKGSLVLMSTTSDFMFYFTVAAGWEAKDENYKFLDSKLHSYYDERVNKGIIFECSSNADDDRYVYHFDSFDRELQTKNNCPEGVTIIQNNYYYDRNREHGVILCSSNDDEAISYGICYYYANNDTWQFKSFSLPFVDTNEEIDMFYSSSSGRVFLAVGNETVSLYSSDDYENWYFRGTIPEKLNNSGRYWQYNPEMELILVFDGDSASRNVYFFNPIGEDLLFVPVKFGCMDSNATNYNSEATVDDGSCPPTVSDISISPNPADSSERVYFSANYSDSDGNVIAFEWSSDIDGILNISSSFDSDDLSVGHHNISFRVMDDDGTWSDYVYRDLVIEDECSFESFMDNIYVQSPSISGPVIDEYMLLEVGKGSYHFVSEDNVYISWETTDLSGIKLDNGLPLPSKKSFTETTFDYEDRIFTGKIDFALEGGTYGGAASWDYQMIFSEDYTSIIGGQIYRIDSGNKIFYTWTFGEDENYPYCALCTLTAADYYSENPFEDTTSPDEQVTIPEDGGFTLPFSGNPLAYGAIIFILGLLGAGFAAMSARQSLPGLISELQGLVDAGISDPELNSALEDLENMDGLGFFSNDRANAMRILDNYNEMTDQALGSMRQLDELQGVVDELQAAGVSSPELEAEIAEIESMLNSQVEGDTNKDFSGNFFESFRKNRGGG